MDKRIERIKFIKVILENYHQNDEDFDLFDELEEAFTRNASGGRVFAHGAPKRNNPVAATSTGAGKVKPVYESGGKEGESTNAKSLGTRTVSPKVATGATQASTSTTNTGQTRTVPIDQQYTSTTPNPATVPPTSSATPSAEEIKRISQNAGNMAITDPQRNMAVAQADALRGSRAGSSPPRRAAGPPRRGVSNPPPATRTSTTSAKKGIGVSGDNNKLKNTVGTIGSINTGGGNYHQGDIVTNVYGGGESSVSVSSPEQANFAGAFAKAGQSNIRGSSSTFTFSQKKQPLLTGSMYEEKVNRIKFVRQIMEKKNARRHSR